MSNNTESTEDDNDIINNIISARLRTNNKKETFKCDICHKILLYKTTFVSHLRLHSGEKPHSCEFCHKSFTNKSEIVVHLRVHTGDKPYKCSDCKKTFTQKSSLTTHLQLHNEDKPFQCAKCEKAYKQKNQLTMHAHTHEEHFKCESCNLNFTQNSYLRKHNVINHPDKVIDYLDTSTNSDITCELCSRKFDESCDLTQHLLQHFEANSESTMDKTLGINDLVKPNETNTVFKCEICFKRYDEGNALTAHLLQHIENEGPALQAQLQVNNGDEPPKKKKKKKKHHSENLKDNTRGKLLISLQTLLHGNKKSKSKNNQP